MTDFIHLHNHSHYSLLDGACRINDMVKTASKFHMPALALTDHGNMFGAIEFHQKCKNKEIKPILGSEVYVAPTDHTHKVVDSETGVTAYHLVLLCKNLTGYRNLMKLVSIGYLDGFYYKPRIDKALLSKYHDGLIALSACLKGEVATRFLKQGGNQAREALRDYKEIFGDDFYLEIQNHSIEEEDNVRPQLLQLGEDEHVKVVATNDIHYLKKEHHAAHDVLLCLQTGKDYDDPNRMRYTTHELYFKSKMEMLELFSDTPEVLTNTLEVADKCDLELSFDDYLLPNYDIPEDDDSKDLHEFLSKICHKGLKERYKEPTPEIEERLDHELAIIKEMGYSGYFLITQDFINYARQKNIPVGPGRGSAAGSLVAYVLGITNLDPLAYGLLFERFLNPERVSMPDIDIDFCYERREEVIDYVKEKYGYNSVCQIITFGTMAARAVIRDVGRVLNMSFSEVDKIAKLVPQQLKITLDKAIETVPELRQLEKKDEKHRKLIEYSRVLEGLARHASTHAAGVVITPDELTRFIPLYKTKDGDITTQYDMRWLEEMGVLKMDFLGLRTLTVIQKTIDSVKARGIDLDIEQIPLDDSKVFQLFEKGETIAVFQFESSGMREYLKKLKPDCLEDLIAMNALYRPGPMDNIDAFIRNRKGTNEFEYPHNMLKPILRDTYGIAVYQEQVMKMASDIAGFSMGKSDVLRRAMGKKKKNVMIEMRAEFVEGAQKKGLDEKKANEIFNLMEKFAGYGFNKSHAACYSLVAYQTGYLKVYYPAEFMAATISSEMNSTDRVIVLLEECRRMGIRVLPPDVNQSCADFIVTKDGIQFGLGAIKNVGRGAIEAIVTAREKNGPFTTIFDLCTSVDLHATNRKMFESLVEAGAMDSLDGNRAQLFQSIETAIEYAHRTQTDKANGQTSIFDNNDDVEIAAPSLAELKDWDKQAKLNREKNVLGFYLSGHPLDRYREEVKTFSNVTLQSLSTMKEGSTARICCIISEIKIHYDRKKRPMAFLKLEDFGGTAESIAFSDQYEEYRELLYDDSMVMVKGKVNFRDSDEAKLILDEVIPLEQTRERFTKSLCLAIQTGHSETEILDEVRRILNQHIGEIPVYIKLIIDENENYMLKSKSLKVSPTLELVDLLRDKVGRENVWVGA
ncbi:DNA polymerase III subunit alpha [candidate division KSB1 bacterium]|nr:DNA polymerase III subunit alpha [candidate division KSB1 bacterium]